MTENNINSLIDLNNALYEGGYSLEVMNGYELKKPLIVSGGCGSLDDIKELKKKFKNASVALASVLHYKTLKISEINFLK